MSAQTETTNHVARKNHRCTWCWQLVKPGESYKRYRFFDGGDTGTVKMAVTRALSRCIPSATAQCRNWQQRKVDSSNGCPAWSARAQPRGRHRE